MSDQRSPSEIQIQGEIWVTLWADYHEARRCLFHVPNESTYDNSQQASSGVIPGIQDMIFVWAGKTWYIELKDDTGRLSNAQALIHSQWKRQGYDTYVFYNASDCIAFLRAIITGAVVLTDFDRFISPYSKAELYDELLSKYMKERAANRAKRAEKAAEHNKKLFAKRYKY